MMDSQHLMVVFAQPRAGREDAFRQWYRTHNIDPIVAMDGIQTLQRFELEPGASTAAPGSFLGLYGIAPGRLEDVQAGFRRLTDERAVDERAGREPSLPKPPDLDYSIAWHYTAITPVMRQMP